MTNPPDDDVLHHDHRTLRLANPSLTPELLERFIRYQESSLAHAEQGRADEARLSEAHLRGLEASGLTGVQAGQIAALVRAFAGSLSAIQHLKRRIAEAHARMTDGTSDSVASDSDLVARLGVELARLEPMIHLSSRYGRAAITLLQAHGDRLLALHERTHRVFTGGGTR